jgi:hypothetical protein
VVRLPPFLDLHMFIRSFQPIQVSYFNSSSRFKVRATLNRVRDRHNWIGCISCRDRVFHTFWLSFNISPSTPKTLFHRHRGVQRSRVATSRKPRYDQLSAKKREVIKSFVVVLNNTRQDSHRFSKRGKASYDTRNPSSPLSPDTTIGRLGIRTWKS